LLFLCLSAQSLIANSNPIHPILSKLLTTKGAVRICYLGTDIWKEIDDLPWKYNSEGQHLIKTDKGLFLTIPGTGRLYKAKLLANKIEFDRIDSTYFSGYNFNSLSFNIGNQIYNFGGEGFWHTNGGLRLFDTTNHEWNAIRLNKSVHKNFNLKYPGTFFYYLDNKSNLYIEGSISDQNYLKDSFADSTFKNKLYKLNINNGDWRLLGKKNYHDYFYSISFTPFGILSYENLIDLENNKVYNHNLSPRINSIFGNSNKDNNITISFCVDSTIYFGNANNRFDSLTISRSNLLDTNQLAYIPIETPSLLSKMNLLVIFLISSSLCLLIFFSYKYFKKSIDKNESTPISSSIQNTNNKSIDNPIIYKSGKLVELLTDQEKEFVSYIFNKSTDERLTTIEETNRILGTLNKSIDIQKRVRGEMINGINQKLSIITKVKRPIIDKQRSEFDKRSFEYYINPEHFNLVKDILSLKKNI
jgi:hypothetical protein